MQGKYENRSPEWWNQLNAHLLKEEIKWVSAHGGDQIDFLKGYCGDTDAMKGYLRNIGFKVRGTFFVDSTWIEVDGKISVCVENGFVCCSK